MNNFIFQNATKVYFGKGCVKEYLSCLTEPYAHHHAGLWGRLYQGKRYLR